LPRSYTLVTALKACAFLKDLEQGQKIHSQAMENGFEQDSFVGNSLISMYVKCGSIQHAQGVFNKLLVRDVISWTSLISGYAEYGPWQEISVCLDQMQVEGISPSVVTVACSLKACGKLEDLGKGRQIHMDITMK
ncbi:hypothetical protein, partial [Acinetobacter pittii]|uniref:hypothetical protein n=1 Tax=Acinetobacter pittii TaxID=48296 RepID=UPI00168D2789